ncbi:hypothetical protein ACN08Y_04400 [Rothia sp. P5764]|uniref:hypothetical protein n=1 Tax=Rothia sp. P5764 TaxID=3402654 RepID=UPI003AD1E378
MTNTFPAFNSGDFISQVSRTENIFIQILFSVSKTINLRLKEEMNIQQVPNIFVWQRAGAESSSDFQQTVTIKEIQRAQNEEGIFLWGVGNSFSEKTLELLLAKNSKPLVLFTHIISKFRPIDVESIANEYKNIRFWEKPKSLMELYSTCQQARR